MKHYPNCRALTNGHCDCDDGAIQGQVGYHDADLGTCVWPLEYTKDSAPIPPSPPGDPFLSPAQTNPTAGTPEDAAAQLDMAGDLDRALKAREGEGGEP